MEKIDSVTGKRLLSALFVCILLCIACTKEDDSNDNRIKVKEATINVTVNTGDDYFDNDLSIISAYEEDELAVEPEVEVKTYDSGNPEILIVTDNYSGNTIMMSRDYHHNDKKVTIDAQSTAVALASLHPVFLSVSGEDYQILADQIRNSVNFQNVVDEVQKCIDARSEITSRENESLLIALNNLLDELCEGMDEEYINLNASGTRAVDMSRYPLNIQMDQGTLTFRTVWQAPSYNGVLGSPKYGTSGFRVQGRDDIGILDLGGWAWDKLRRRNSSIMGESTEVRVVGEGEFTVYLTIDYDEMAGKVILNVISTMFPAISAGLDLKDAKVASEIVSMVNEIVGYIKDDSMSFEDIASATCDLIRANMTVLGKVLVGDEAKWYTNTVRKIANCVGNTFNIYGQIKNAGNGLSKIYYWKTCPQEIMFTFCFDEDRKGSDCTPLDIEIVNGNEQEGEAKQRLLLPLTVRVTTVNEELPEIEKEGVQGAIVAFSDPSDEGKLSSYAVRTDKDGYATTYWTLGEGDSGERQRVKAFVVSSVDPRIELSEPVEFVAKVREPSDITVRLDWHKLSGDTDLDLHVIDPYGVEIYFDHPYSSSSGGQLDRDDRVGPGPEHIYFKKAVPGTYYVRVHYYESVSGGVTTYKVTIYRGEESKVFSGSIGYHQTVPVTTINVNRTRSSESGWEVEEADHWPMQFTYPAKE